MPKNLIKKKSRIHALFKILVYKDMCIRVDLAAAKSWKQMTADRLNHRAFTQWGY